MRVAGIKKRYKIGSGTVEALDGISFDLPDTGMVFILGKSGCGKSTLLNVLSGLDSFDSGDVIFKGKSLKDFSEAELNDYRNSCCGFVFQEYNLIPELNVHDNIALALELQGEKDVTDKVNKALTEMRLRGYGDRKVAELSGGEKQRIAIARCIVKDPQIIFADEPSGALDSDTGALLFALLKKLSKDRLVIVVTHDRESAFTYGDRVIELESGKVVGDTQSEFKATEGKDTYAARPSKMPLKSAIKIGCSNYKFHPIRLVATVLLAVFSFTFFGLTFVFATFSKVTPFVNMVYSSDARYLTVKKYNSYKPNTDNRNIFDKLTGDLSYSWEDVAYTNEDLQRLQSKMSEDLMLVTLNLDGIRLFDETAIKYPFSNSITDKINSAEEHITGDVAGYMTITEKVIEQKGLRLVGRLAEKASEIVISECNYNYFKLLGYKDEEGNTYEINTPEDIIGHKIRDHALTVTGVLYTGCDHACSDNNHPIIHRKYNGKTLSITPKYYPEYFSLESDMLFHEKYFVTTEYIAELMEGDFECMNNSFVLCPVPKAKKDLRRFVRFVSSYNKQGYNKAGVYYRFEPWSTLLSAEDAATVNEYNDPSIALHPSQLNQKVDWYITTVLSARQMSVLCLYLAGIFFIFTFILLLNFITLSIRGQTKQVGIISALGADFKEIYKVYGLSTLIVCGGIYLLSLIIVGIGASALNSPKMLWFNGEGMAFKLLSLNIWTILGMLVIALGTALLGTLIALRKYRKLTPADIIRKGMIK